MKAQVRGSQKRKIWMEGVKCKGSEMALDDCKFNNWQNHECSPWNVVSVKCKPGKDRKRGIIINISRKIKETWKLY